MFRLCLSLIALIIGLVCIPAYADELPNPQPTPELTSATAQLFKVSLPLITRDGSSTIIPAANTGMQTVLTLVNKQRALAGCPALALDPQLTQAAQTQALDMAQHNFLGHIGTDGSDVGVRVDRTGYPWQIVAENLAVGQPTPDNAVAGWMSSANHRANILDCSLRETGIGFVYLPNDPGTAKWSFYWTQVFATR